jgi:hypothetical protein
VEQHPGRVDDGAEQRRLRGVDASARIGDDRVEASRGTVAVAGPEPGRGHGAAGAFGDDGARHTPGAGVVELPQHPLDAR